MDEEDEAAALVGEGPRLPLTSYSKLDVYALSS